MNGVRKALLNREPSLGTWIQVGDPAVGEIFAKSGFDWVAIDCEHTAIGLTAMATVLTSLGLSDVVPLVRVRENDTLAIRQALDVGAAGVIVPLIASAEDARRAVSAAKYPPDGVRGFAFSRVNDFGESFDDYVARANADTIVVGMIETREGIENIDEILAVDGIDGVFVGPYDLSGSYGVPGQTGCDAVREGCGRIVEACGRAGKSAGMHVVRPTPDAIRAARSDGFTFIGLGMDTVFLIEGARNVLKQARD